MHFAHTHTQTHAQMFQRENLSLHIAKFYRLRFNSNSRRNFNGFVFLAIVGTLSAWQSYLTEQSSSFLSYLRAFFIILSIYLFAINKQGQQQQQQLQQWWLRQQWRLIINTYTYTNSSEVFSLTLKFALFFIYVQLFCVSFECPTYFYSAMFAPFHHQHQQQHHYHHRRRRRLDFHYI